MCIIPTIQVETKTAHHKNLRVPWRWPRVKAETCRSAN